jgi:hypothetical protein
MGVPGNNRNGSTKLSLKIRVFSCVLSKLAKELKIKEVSFIALSRVRMFP